MAQHIKTPVRYEHSLLKAGNVLKEQRLRSVHSTPSQPSMPEQGRLSQAVQYKAGHYGRRITLLHAAARDLET